MSGLDEAQQCRIVVQGGTTARCQILFEEVAAADYFKSAGWWP